LNKIFSPKLFTLLHDGISKQQVIKDITAGVVVGIVALPLSIAFAVACGLSPEKGLITAIIAGLLISVLGGSRVQIGGPTGAFVIIIVGIVDKFGINGLIISTVLAGLILIVFGLLKLGDLLKYFPHSLIVGFTSGIALVIFSTQIRDAFGFEIDTVPANFIEKWKLYFSSIHEINYTAFSITIQTIAIGFFSKKITTKVPGSIISILIFTCAVTCFNLPVKTIESFFGEIPGNIQFQLPQFQITEIGNYIAPALTIAILGGLESLLSAVVSDGMIGGHHRSNTELIGQGIANIITPFFGGIPATGAIARTATNVKNGGRTPISGIVHAITLLLIMLLLGKWAKLIPMPCLAGILIVVAFNMSEWRSFVSILKSTSFFDIIILLSTFLLTVLVDLTIAIEIGVVLSAILFMRRMADISSKNFANNIDSDVIEDYSKIPKGINVYEISGPLFFASARQYSQLIETIGIKSRILIIRMRHVSFIDLTGIRNLKEAIKTLKSSNVEVVLSGTNSEVSKNLLKHNVINESNIFNSFDEAMVYANIKIEQNFAS
jgi:SulP family sulfate permease